MTAGGRKGSAGSRPFWNRHRVGLLSRSKESTPRKTDRKRDLSSGGPGHCPRTFRLARHRSRVACAGPTQAVKPPEPTELVHLVDVFAELLTPTVGNDTQLTAWITAARTADLLHLHSFTGGLEPDRAAVDAALTLHHNSRTEGVNTRTKRIMRQMHGRAGFDLLRHRILLQ